VLIGELASVSNRPQERLDEILSRLMRGRLVVEEERGRELSYEITHPLIQETIYRSIAGGRRRALHRLVGRSLLASGRPGEAAPHYARSADPGDTEAIEALCEALLQAEQRDADLEALEILAALVELVPPGDERWMAVAETMSWQADWVLDHRADNAELGIRAVREMATVLAGSADLVRRGVVHLRLASFLGWGAAELEEAEEAGREALTLLERGGDVGWALLAANELAWIKGLAGDSPGMDADSRRLVEAARTHGQRLALMQALTTAGNAAMFRGRFEEATSDLEQSLAIASEDGKRYEQTRVLTVLALSLAYEGRMDAALARLEQAKKVNPLVPPTWEPLVLWIRGRYREARESVERAVAWKPIGLSKRRGILLGLAALSAAEADLLDEARIWLAKAATVYADKDFMMFANYCRYAHAVVAYREGAVGAALAELRREASAILDADSWPFASPMLCDLAEFAAESGELEVATEATRQLEELARRADRDLHSAFAMLAGACVSLTPERDRAAENARVAAEIFARLGYQGFHARALHLLGRALRNDRAGAIDALQEAAAIFDSCGATWRRDRSLDTLRGLRGRGRRAAGAVLGATALTSREWEVTRLATQGLTAVEIATRLFISERTAEGHLAGAYAKLGVRSKTELMRRRSEWGL
jgi:DNA-binding CsgD family transcriptional regulator